jgi:hypothetical protein
VRTSENCLSFPEVLEIYPLPCTSEFDPEESRKKENGENCTVRAFITCTVRAFITCTLRAFITCTHQQIFSVDEMDETQKIKKMRKDFSRKN